jgi:hypothetical protein
VLRLLRVYTQECLLRKRQKIIGKPFSKVNLHETYCQWTLSFTNTDFGYQARKRSRHTTYLCIPRIIFCPYMYSDLGRFTDAVPARVVLYMMSFTGFLVSFMMRTDINIAMVAMVKFQSNANNSNSNSSQPYCYVATEPGTSARGNVSELLFNDTMLLEKPNVNVSMM